LTEESDPKKTILRQVDDGFHMHRGNHSSAHKNQYDISHGEEFTITIAMGPRMLIRYAQGISAIKIAFSTIV